MRQGRCLCVLLCRAPNAVVAPAVVPQVLAGAADVPAQPYFYGLRGSVDQRPAPVSAEAAGACEGELSRHGGLRDTPCPWFRCAPQARSSRTSCAATWRRWVFPTASAALATARLTCRPSWRQPSRSAASLPSCRSPPPLRTSATSSAVPWWLTRTQGDYLTVVRAPKHACPSAPNGAAIGYSFQDEGKGAGHGLGTEPACQLHWQFSRGCLFSVQGEEPR